MTRHEGGHGLAAGPALAAITARGPGAGPARVGKPAARLRRLSASNAAWFDTFDPLDPKS